MTDPTGLFASCTGKGAASPERELPFLPHHPMPPDPATRFTQLARLRALYAERGAHLPPGGLKALLALAAGWRDWPLAAALGERLHGAGGLDTQDTLHLVDACRALGKAERALELAGSLHGRAPDEGRYARLVDALRSWRNWRAGFPSAGAAGCAAELALEPLAHHHAQDFLWQYHDPAIAALCCLPVFIDELDWHYWLADVWRDGSRLPHAVLHREWGFIGCVSLAVHRDVGFFYYWLGADFQGRGHGPRAGALLLSLAQQAYGLRCCYAKVYDHNLRSRRGLQKMGFADLGIRGAGEDCNQVFYRRGPTQARRRIVGELHWLLACMDAQVRPAAQPAASCEDAAQA